MTRGLFVVLTDPVAGREDEFHSWYERHVGEVVQMDGWASARRFALVDAEVGGSGHGHLAVYEVDDIDVARASLEAARERRDAAGNPPEAFLHTSDAKRPDKQVAWWVALGDPVTAD